MGSVPGSHVHPEADSFRVMTCWDRVPTRSLRRVILPPPQHTRTVPHPYYMETPGSSPHCYSTPMYGGSPPPGAPWVDAYGSSPPQHGHYLMAAPGYGGSPPYSPHGYSPPQGFSPPHPGYHYHPQYPGHQGSNQSVDAGAVALSALSLSRVGGHTLEHGRHNTRWTMTPPTRGPYSLRRFLCTIEAQLGSLTPCLPPCCRPAHPQNCPAAARAPRFAARRPASHAAIVREGLITPARCDAMG